MTYRVDFNAIIERCAFHLHRVNTGQHDPADYETFEDVIREAVGAIRDNGGEPDEWADAYED